MQFEFRGLWASECAQTGLHEAPTGPCFLVAVAVAGGLLASLVGGFVFCYLFMDVTGRGNVT